jgi:hypothetical protein
MPHADGVLADEEIVLIVYEALAKRRPKSRRRGCYSAPAEQRAGLRFGNTREVQREVKTFLRKVAATTVAALRRAIRSFIPRLALANVPTFSGIQAMLPYDRNPL